MEYKIDSEYIIQALSDLVRINSVNPSRSPAGKGEAEIGVYVADSLADLGLSVTTFEIKHGRMNVVGVLKGTGDGRSLLLNAHMDTVGVEGMIVDPFGAEIREGRLYGRGAQDMKGSLAAMMGAAKALVDGGIDLAGDLLVTAVADEEHGSMGMDDLVQHVTADAAILAAAGIETALVGPIGGGLHSEVEWVDIQSVEDLAHILAETAVNYCR